MAQKEAVLQAVNKHLDMFYRLKNEYESEFKKKIIKPIVESEKSFKEKRKLLRDAPKARCVNCKRPVGSVFSINHFQEENSLESGRIFTAKCGDTEDPCPLNILLKVQNVIPYQRELAYMEDEINSYKKDIIKEKNNLVFGYTDKENFGDYFYELTAELESKVELYNVYLNNYVQSVENPERQNELKKLIITYGANIEQIKTMMKEYNETGAEEIVNNVVTMYIDDMLPLGDKIFNYKYHVNLVETHDEMSYLLQKRNRIDEEEINNNSYKKIDEIIQKFVVGVQNAPTLRKTIKATEPVKNNVTRRATTVNLVIEDEDDSPPIVIDTPPLASAKAKATEKATTRATAKATAIVTPVPVVAPTPVIPVTPVATTNVGITKKQPMNLVEESSSSPVLNVSSPAGEKSNLFLDPALNTAYEALSFDEQLRILEMPDEQDRINAVRLTMK
jgi:hypothetical protein